MALDMTGPARHNRDVHYRRYLTADGAIRVICVQDFDYHDYDPARFVDHAQFGTEIEAEVAPIDLEPLLEVMEQVGDPVASAQAERLVRAALRHNGVTA